MDTLQKRRGCRVQVHTRCCVDADSAKSYTRYPFGEILTVDISRKPEARKAWSTTCKAIKISERMLQSDQATLSVRGRR